MGFLDNTGLNLVWNKIKNYIDSRGSMGSVRQMQTVSVTQSVAVAVNSFGSDITVDLSRYGFKNVPAVVTQEGGWLEARVKSVSSTSLVVQFYNAGNTAHTGGAKFTLIELLTSNDVINDLGKIYTASKNVNIAKAGIDDYTQGASLTLPAGTYILLGEWCFNTTGATERTIQARIADSNNVAYGFQRLHMSNSYYTELQVTGLVSSTAQTTYNLLGSCSAIPAKAGNTHLQAIRIK